MLLNRFSSYSFSSKTKNQFYLPELSVEFVDFIRESRSVIADIVSGKSNKLLVIVGPCSIHDVDAAIVYAEKLAALQERYQDKLTIVMRVYVEKSRTSLGWKGLLLQPDLTDAFDLNSGCTLVHKLFSKITSLRLPIATEIINPYYMDLFKDFISWGVIGARSVESQIHRELVSGLSFPVGFKNRTDGDFITAINAIISASSANSIYCHAAAGSYSLVTTGNQNTHLVLRGGKQPNYDLDSILQASKQLSAKNISNKLIIDCSHGNSNKSWKQQIQVAEKVSMQIKDTSAVCGVMLESFLEAGKQDFQDKSTLKYGQSITDECLDFASTARLIGLFYKNI